MPYARAMPGRMLNSRRAIRIIAAAIVPNQAYKRRCPAVQKLVPGAELDPTAFPAMPLTREISPDFERLSKN